MVSWNGLTSVARLKELAKTPLDLAQEGVLTPQRIKTYMAGALGMKLLYATERVSEDVLCALEALAQETHVLENMEAMQAGEVVNLIRGFESEERPALHTAMRDFFNDKNASPKALEAAKLAYQEVEKLKNFLKTVEERGRFTTMIQVGIGGSELGPKALYLGLKAYRKKGRSVHFLSNVDPDEGAEIFQEVDLSKTLVVVVSKSGSTLETLTNETYVKEQLKKQGLNPKEHLIAVTGKGSPMDDPSKYLASFYMWDYVGGRYSGTSMVGGVALAFALGMDRYLDLLCGASAMDKQALCKEVRKNLPLLSALLGVWNRNFLDLPTCAVIPYSAALSRFSAHLQQLDMESNGKRIDKNGKVADWATGPIIWGEPGTNGQHSFFQHLHQGTTVTPLEILGFKESQYKQDVIVQGTSSQEKLLANLFAQSLALAVGQKSENPNKAFPGNRPNRILLCERLDPYTMGMILSYYEHKVAFQGFLWNINSFDQEGVQLGKKLALKFLDQFQLKAEGKEFDAKAFPLGTAYLESIK